MRDNRFLKRLRKKAKKGLRGWPLATIAFYGPNLSQATKAAVAKNANLERVCHPSRASANSGACSFWLASSTARSARAARCSYPQPGIRKVAASSPRLPHPRESYGLYGTPPPVVPSQS